MTHKEGTDLLHVLTEFQVEVMRRFDELAGIPAQIAVLTAHVEGHTEQFRILTEQVNNVDGRLVNVERRLIRLDDRVSSNRKELLAAIQGR